MFSLIIQTSYKPSTGYTTKTNDVSIYLRKILDLEDLRQDIFSSYFNSIIKTVLSSLYGKKDQKQKDWNIEKTFRGNPLPPPLDLKTITLFAGAYEKEMGDKTIISEISDEESIKGKSFFFFLAVFFFWQLFFFLFKNFFI